MPIMQGNNKITRKTPYQQAKERVEAIKNKLPNNWRSILFTKHKEYDNKQGYNLINNVFYLKSTDLLVIERMEAISKEYIKSLLSTEAA